MADGTGAKRTSSPARKTMRSLCFQRGEKRKDKRRQAQEVRQANNRRLTTPTPWQRSKAARAARRDADPQVQARRAYWNRVRGVSAA